MYKTVKRKFFLIICFMGLMSIPASCGNSNQTENATSSNIIDKTITSENVSIDDQINSIYFTIKEQKLEVILSKNSSVEALIKKLKERDIHYLAQDYGGFEKVGKLDFVLPTSHSQINAVSGDIMLYGNDQIVLFYGRNSWSYTRIGKFMNITNSELSHLLGKGSLEIKISLY